MNDLFPLRLTNVSVRRRGRVILGPVDLRLDAPGMTMIIGPNGSGKTTLLRVMHGVERLSQGTATWALPTKEARARQAYVFQSPVMLRRSVADNLRYPLQLTGAPKAHIESQMRHWADKTGLGALLETAATRLSGGERQKLALARGLIREPDVLFLDEPCANLDRHATRDIETLLFEAAETGTRIIMATHDMGQAKRLATDVIFVVDGQILETGTKEQMFDAPRTPELRAFLNGEIF